MLKYEFALESTSFPLTHGGRDGIDGVRSVGDENSPFFNGDFIISSEQHVSRLIHQERNRTLIQRLCSQDSFDCLSLSCLLWCSRETSSSFRSVSTSYRVKLLAILKVSEVQLQRKDENITFVARARIWMVRSFDSLRLPFRSMRDCIYDIG